MTQWPVLSNFFLGIPTTVRVKGGMSLRNGMWHGLQNDIIMHNVKYGKWPEEIN